jgi:hypothetical protein
LEQLPRTLRRSGRLGCYALLLSLAIYSVAAGATSDAKNAAMKLIQTLITIVALCIVCNWDESVAQNNTGPLVQTGAKWEVIGRGYQAIDGPAWDFLVRMENLQI